MAMFNIVQFQEYSYEDGGYLDNLSENQNCPSWRGIHAL